MEQNNNGKPTPTEYVLRKMQMEIDQYHEIEMYLDSLLASRINVDRIELSYTAPDKTQKKVAINMYRSPEISLAFTQFVADSLHMIGIAIQNKKNAMEFMRFDSDRLK